jgi:hypothetical protein
MSGYKKPKTKLHREFLYLNSDSVINSLSAFESGKIDEIIEKVSEAREGGVSGNIGYGPAKAGGAKKKSSNVEEELTRSRTSFSAFEGWYRHLKDNDALGELDDWDLDTRNEIQVGDAIEFRAHVTLSPVQRVFLTFIDYANEASNPDSPFKQPAAKVAELKKQARMMSNWMKGRTSGNSIMVSISPVDVPVPRVIARLDEAHLVAGTQFVEGDFTVIAQVESLIKPGEAVPAIRILRETPPTPKETETITDALQGFIEPAAELGVEITGEDITLGYPGVILNPIAIFR